MTAGNVPCSTCLSGTNSFATPGIPIRSKHSPIQRSHLRSGLPLVSPPAPTRNRCRCRLNSLSSLNSHISTGKQGANVPLRKQPTRNRCRSGLTSLSSLNSHISTGKQGVNVPLRRLPTRNRCRSRLTSLSSLNSHISTGERGGCHRLPKAEVQFAGIFRHEGSNLQFDDKSTGLTRGPSSLSVS